MKAAWSLPPKARIWASEGWNIVVTDGEGKTYQPADFEKLLAA